MKKLVVTPTYNELENIAGLIESVLDLPGEFDIVVVDDASPDGTADLVERYCRESGRVRLIRRKGLRGLGRSYVDGFKYALSNGYEGVFSMDADFSHDPADLPKLADALGAHDVAIGSRYCGACVSVVNWPLRRLLLSLCAGRYVRLVTGLAVCDPTSGFRGFRAGVLAAINLDTIRSNGYSFQVETLYRTHRCGFGITEVPIVFTERREGESKMSGKVILEAALMPWQLRLRRFKRSVPVMAPDERRLAA